MFRRVIYLSLYSLAVFSVVIALLSCRKANWELKLFALSLITKETTEYAPNFTERRFAGIKIGEPEQSVVRQIGAPLLRYEMCGSQVAKSQALECNLGAFNQSIDSPCEVPVEVVLVYSRASETGSPSLARINLITLQGGRVKEVDSSSIVND